MIKKLEIENFQGHKNTTLELGPGMNMITGEGNDIGKTAILRALGWVLANRPLGEGFIRKKQDSPAKVTITTEDVQVCRTKGKGVDSYTIPSDKGFEPLTSFGKNPPSEIVDILNFSDANIQTQHERAFLVLDPPGQVALRIRDATGLDIIDKVVSIIDSKKKEKSAKLKGREADLEETSSKLDVLLEIDLDRLEELVREAQKILKTKEELFGKMNRLRSIISNLKEVEANWIELPDNVDQVLEKGGLISSRRVELDSLHTNLRRIISNLKSVEEKLSLLPSEVDSKIFGIGELERKYNNTCSKVERLADLIEQIEKVDSRLITKQKELKGLEKEHSLLLGQLRCCPSCGQELDEKAKKVLLGDKE